MKSFFYNAIFMLGVGNLCYASQVPVLYQAKRINNKTTTYYGSLKGSSTERCIVIFDRENLKYTGQIFDNRYSALLVLPKKILSQEKAKEYFLELLAQDPALK